MYNYDEAVLETFNEAIGSGTIRMARKPHSPSDLTKTDFYSLNTELKDALVALPEVTIDDSIFNEGSMGFFSQFPIDYNKNQFYIISTGSSVFFVDNQGFDYARYATELVNIKF